MPRGAEVLVALALVMTASATATASTSGLPAGFSVVATSNLYRGVDYVKLVKSKSPTVATHIARVAPGAPVDLRVVSADDKITSSTRELETTSSMCRRVNCVVGVNGDFYKLGAPTGAVISDGRMLRSPDPDRPQLTQTADGHLQGGPLPWSGSVSANGLQLPVAAVNADPPANGLAVFTADYGTRTELSARTELVVKAPGGRATIGRLNQPAKLELVGLRTGPGPIPPDGAVLSGDGPAGQKLRELWDKRQKPAAALQLDVSSPVDAVMSIGAEPVVLHDGRRALPWRDPNLINPRQPHTLVGWNKAGEVYLVAVDGRQPGSDGMTMAEAADFLLALGVTDAVNLDGGGGTTFVAGGSIWNRPSDNDPVHPAQFEERGGTNALVVTARPGAPGPAPAPPPPEPTPVPPATAPGAGGRAPGQAPSQPTGLPWQPGQAWQPDTVPDSGTGAPSAAPGHGRPAAPGELPLGPAADGRPTADQGAAPSAPGAGDAIGAPAGAPGDTGAGAYEPDAATPTGRTTLAASPLGRGVDAGGNGWRLAWAGLVAAVTTGAGAGIASPVLRRRRRRRRPAY